MTEPCRKCGGWTANEDGHRDECPDKGSECADLKRAAEIVRRSARRFPNSGHEQVENALADRLEGYAVGLDAFREACEADANRMIRGTAAHYQSKILALTEQVSQLRAAIDAAARRGVADTETTDALREAAGRAFDAIDIQGASEDSARSARNILGPALTAYDRAVRAHPEDTDARP